MKLNRVIVTICLLVFTASLPNSQAAFASEETWRSTLYPEQWTPLYKDEQGRFLHDFSYAGYHRGERPIPHIIPGLTYNAVSQYGADPTGATDSTVAIQAAIDAAGLAGGGIVYLPGGTYKVSPQSNNEYVLWINRSNVVLRGAGSNETFLFNDDPYMREKDVIKISPIDGGNWYEPINDSTAITIDLLEPTKDIPVQELSDYSVGDWIVLYSDATAAFIAEHGMTGKWATSIHGPVYYRQVTKIDTVTNTLTIDIPTRYPLRIRDNARVYKAAPSIEEIGVEKFSMGMRQNKTPGYGENDYNTAGKGAYEVNNSRLVHFSHAVNSWVDDIRTYKPSVNSGDYHILSNGIYITKARSITIQNSYMAKPQYEGGGGNGYGFILEGSDNLLQYNTAHHTRHNYSFKTMSAHGNVLYRNESNFSSFGPSDFHMWLSMANLIDNMTMYKDYWETKYRPYGTILHGHTSTQSVFWNTRGREYTSGKKYIIESDQYRNGYIIGTQGAASGVLAGSANAPQDFVEGVGLGATLEPASLYLDQKAKRIGKITIDVSEDTYVRGGNYANNNYGSDARLEVKHEPSAGYKRQSFLKFNIAELPAIGKATLRFYGAASTGLVGTMEAYGVTNNTWTEEGLKWNNAPTATTGLLSTVRVNDQRAYKELDVTSFIKSQAMIDDTATIILKGKNNESVYMSINAKESGQFAPQLIVEPLTPIALKPIEDTFVREGSYADTNLGTSEVLEIKSNAAADERIAYLKFNLASISSVQDARLRIYGGAAATLHDATVEVFAASDEVWSEDEMTWNTAPAQYGSVAAKLRIIDDQKWYWEFDVTKLVQEETAGEGVVTFVLKSPNHPGKFMAFNSSKAADHHPQLLIIP